jgi:hypothetical protein
MEPYGPAWRLASLISAQNVKPARAPEGFSLSRQSFSQEPFWVRICLSKVFGWSLAHQVQQAFQSEQKFIAQSF